MPDERRTVGPKARKELEATAAELKQVRTEIAALKKREAALTKAVKDTARRFDLPYSAGATQYLNMPGTGESLRATRPEKTLVIMPEVLRDTVGCEIFHRVFVIKSGELDLDKWLMLQDMEMVTESQLMAAVPPEDPNAEESITVSFGKAFDPESKASD